MASGTKRTSLFDGKEFAFRLRDNREADIDERLEISLPRRRYADLEATFLIRRRVKGRMVEKEITRKRHRVDLRDFWPSYYSMARSYLEEKRSDVSILIAKFDAVVRPGAARKGRVRRPSAAQRAKPARRKALARGRKGRKRRTARRRRR